MIRSDDSESNLCERWERAILSNSTNYSFFLLFLVLILYFGVWLFLLWLYYIWVNVRKDSRNASFIIYIRLACVFSEQNMNQRSEEKKDAEYKNQRASVSAIQKWRDIKIGSIRTNSKTTVVNYKLQIRPCPETGIRWCDKFKPERFGTKPEYK